MSTEEGLIRDAIAEVEAARRLLLAPSATGLERSRPHLERAVRFLQAVSPAPDQRKIAPAGLSGLRHAIARVTALLEGSASFYNGWSRRVATAACGYTCGGAPAAPGLPRTLSLEG
jgi:hypothetical protein